MSIVCMCVFACLMLNSSYIWPVFPSFCWDAFSTLSRVFIQRKESDEGTPQAEIQCLTLTNMMCAAVEAELVCIKMSYMSYKLM